MIRRGCGSDADYQCIKYTTNTQQIGCLYYALFILTFGTLLESLVEHHSGSYGDVERGDLAHDGQFSTHIAHLQQFWTNTRLFVAHDEQRGLTEVDFTVMDSPLSVEATT